MGVPAFYRWLSEKYPKITVDMLEERPRVVAGTTIPVDLTQPNPNEIEYDNLYIDMNGIIHPCSHPEDAPTPETEELMYVNVMKYVDRLVAAVRPRRLLFMAIDGTAPRAKMNQQRARRFKSAQEAKERAEVMKEVRAELEAMGHDVPPEKGPEWDSNVITPGTPFMARLSQFLRFYVQDRMNNNKYWQGIKVIFSDAQEPGEGEHKIMGFIRRQRAQPGYDPNQHHILHGLDADLIMLGLATHEARFTILREEVTFGRRNEEARKMARAAAEEAYDAATGGNCSGEWATPPEDQWVTHKPLQRLEIWTLREYLRAEFQCLQGALPFGYEFERVVDDFVFMCFFVGNDFLPHLPSLDIRDGAIDFLFNVYKRVLPGMGGYLTNEGGEVNLHNVDVILREVGRIEDEVFRRRKEAEIREDKRREHYKAQQKQGGADRMAADAAKGQAVAVGKSKKMDTVSMRKLEDGTKIPTGKGVGMDDVRNKAAKHLLMTSLDNVVDPQKRADANSAAAANLKASLFGKDDMDDAMKGSQYAEAEVAIKARVKEKTQEQLDNYRQNVNDTVRLWEYGWKDRYYADKYKNEDIAKGGGRAKVFQSYVEGLCWVMRYYYRGCASWKWYYQFHYAPFASDLVDIWQYKIEFDIAKPFKPIHQLMAVLPPDSSAALPEPSRWLMFEGSPIIDFYPTDVPCDPNGKAMPWLWVVLLPFIDEKRLLDALLPCEEKYTTEEKKRNSYGPGYLFIHSSHPGVQDLFKCYETDTKATLVSQKFESLSGFIQKAKEPELAVAMNESIIAPKQPPGALQDVKKNQVVCVEFELPPLEPHVCRMLPGAQVPPSKLEAMDLMPRRPPRLNRGGMSIADLGGARRNPADRFIRQNLGNARTAEGRFHEAGWGTMEPHGKRIRTDRDDLIGMNRGRKRQNALPCRFFQQGRCNRGDDCKFSHEEAPVQNYNPQNAFMNQQQGYGYQQQPQYTHNSYPPQQGYAGFNYSQNQSRNIVQGYEQQPSNQSWGYGSGHQGGGYGHGNGQSMDNGDLRSQLASTLQQRSPRPHQQSRNQYAGRGYR